MTTKKDMAAAAAAAKKLFNWEPSNNLDAQLSHVGWGGFLCLFFSLIIGPLWAVPILLAIAAAKEFCFDSLVEHDTFKGNLLDFCMYATGIVVGLACWWFAMIGIPS